MSIAQAFYGTFVHSPTTKQLVFLKNTVIVLDRHGKIVSVTSDQSLEQAQAVFKTLEKTKVSSAYSQPSSLR